jgi:hypothetical protein
MVAATVSPKDKYFASAVVFNLSFFVHVPSDAISLQLCTPKVLGVIQVIRSL